MFDLDLSRLIVRLIFDALRGALPWLGRTLMRGVKGKRTGWRKAHGKAAELGATIVWETPPSDEQRTAPEGSAAPIDRRGDGTFTADGARAAGRRRAELAKRPDFAEGELEFVPAKDFAPFDAARRDMLKGTGGEIYAATSGTSRRVWAILRGASWLTSLGEYWATVAASSGDGRAADRAANYISRASVEYQKAWDAACAEAEGRKNANPGAAHEQALAAFSRPALPMAPATNSTPAKEGTDG